MSVNFAQNTDGSARLEMNISKEVEVGQGVVNPNRTYIALRNSAGVKYYLYVDTTTLVVSATKP